MLVASAQSKDTLPASVSDLNAVQLIEIRDSAGAVLLHGTLKTSKNESQETERKADLVSPSGQKAKGKVEVEIERKDGLVTKEELEISMERLPAMTGCELFVDGRHVVSFVTSKAGKAELKLDRKISLR